jgi:signal transduction histidine kinase
MKERRVSVSSIVIAILVAVTTVLLGTFGIINHTLEKDRQLRNLRSELQGEAYRLSTDIALPIWNIDRDQIDKVVESTFKNRNVYGVQVTAAGRVHSRVRDAEWRVVEGAGSIGGSGVLEEDRAVTFSGETIGTVNVYSTPKFVEADLRQSLISTFSIIIVLDIILTVSLYLLLWRVVVRPLRKVEQYAASVSSGDGAATVDSAGFRGELEGLRLSIRKMVELLEVRYLQLQEKVQQHRESENQLHSLAQRLERIREEERKAISHEVHDELGQVLTAIRMDLMSLKGTGPAQKSEFNVKIKSSLGLTDKAIEIVQDISARLRPEMLDYLGLLPAMEWQAGEFQKHSGIQSSLALPDHEPTIDSERATVLFRILQETLTNVARHANAKKVEIRFTESADEVTLSIIDDGIGISQEQVRDPKSLGLLGMRERLFPFNGICTIHMGSQGGTEVLVRIPKKGGPDHHSP